MIGVQNKPYRRISETPWGSLNVNGQMTNAEQTSETFWRKVYKDKQLSNEELRKLMYPAQQYGEGAQTEIYMTREIEPKQRRLSELYEEEEAYRVTKDAILRNEIPLEQITEEDLNLFVYVLSVFLSINNEGYTDLTTKEITEKVSQLIYSKVTACNTIREYCLYVAANIKSMENELIDVLEILAKLKQNIDILNQERAQSDLQRNQSDLIVDPYYNDGMHLSMTEPQQDGSVNAFGTEYHETYRSKIRDSRTNNLNIQDRLQTEIINTTTSISTLRSAIIGMTTEFNNQLQLFNIHYKSIIDWLATVKDFSEMTLVDLPQIMVDVSNFEEFIGKFCLQLNTCREHEIINQRKYINMQIELKKRFDAMMIGKPMYPNVESAKRNKPEPDFELKSPLDDPNMYQNNLIKHRDHYLQLYSKEESYLEELKGNLTKELLSNLRLCNNYNANLTHHVGSVKIANNIIANQNVPDGEYLSIAKNDLIDINMKTKEYMSANSSMMSSIFKINNDIGMSEAKLSAWNNIISALSIQIAEHSDFNSSMYALMGKTIESHRKSMKLSEVTELKARILYARYYEQDEERATYLEHKLGSEIRRQIDEPVILDLDAFKPAVDVQPQDINIDNDNRQHVNYNLHHQPIKATVEKLNL